MPKVLMLIDAPETRSESLAARVKRLLHLNSSATVTEIDLSAEDVEYAAMLARKSVDCEDDIACCEKLYKAAAQLRGD